MDAGRISAVLSKFANANFPPTPAKGALRAYGLCLGLGRGYVGSCEGMAVFLAPYESRV